MHIRQRVILPKLHEVLIRFGVGFSVVRFLAAADKCFNNGCVAPFQVHGTAFQVSEIALWECPAWIAQFEWCPWRLGCSGLSIKFLEYGGTWQMFKKLQPGGIERNYTSAAGVRVNAITYKNIVAQKINKSSYHYLVNKIARSVAYVWYAKRRLRFLCNRRKPPRWSYVLSLDFSIAPHL